MTKKHNLARSPGSDNALDEHSRLKIMLALLGRDLAYTQLAKETKLANNTLVKRLADLKGSAAIAESVRRSTASGKPVVVYSIAKKWKAQLQKLNETMVKMREVGTLCEKRLFSFRQELAETADMKLREKLADDYTDVIITSMVAIFTLGLLYESDHGAWDSFVATQTLSMARQLIWDHAIAPEFEKQLRGAISKESANTLKKLRAM